jgi:cyclopropane fatty-acyl-phospholipid synthase-like methyltransferase
MSHFPRSAKYDLAWVRAGVSGGANSLWLTEWLTDAMTLRPGMRVLDLGCGRASSSIFLHREFGVQVWATDLWFNANDNLKRIREAGVDDGVFPIHSDARSLPFAVDFFDAIVSIDSFPYYGTDDRYLSYVARYLKVGGQIGMAGAGLMREVQSPPSHLKDWWEQDFWCLHSAAWWHDHWAKTGIVDVEVADSMPDGWQVWLNWHKSEYPDNAAEIRSLEADRGEYMGYVRCCGRRRPGIELADPIVSL